MERTSSNNGIIEKHDVRQEVNELDLIISGYMPDHMPTNFWRAYERLKQLAKQAAWPSELYGQYSRVLDERDAAISKVECLENKLTKEEK